MASFGIPSASKSLTATDAADVITLAAGQSAAISASTIVALDGGDLISFAALGETVTGSSNSNGTVTIPVNSGSITSPDTASASLIISGALVGRSSTYQYTNTVTGKAVLVSGGPTTFTVSGSASTAAFLTSTKATRLMDATQVYGNAGNDSIYLGDGMTTFSASTIGGGAGNDLIGTYTYNDQSAASALSTAVTIKSVFIEGGGGNDKVDLNYTDAEVGASTIQGGQGQDTISFIANAGTATAFAVYGGGDNDTISLDIAEDLLNSTVAGGGGKDSITLEIDTTADGVLVLGDAANSISEFDGADTITFSADYATSVTIQGMGGNDLLSAVILDGDLNLIQMNVGDDSVFYSGVLNSATIQLGAGNDIATISAAATGFQASSEIFAGGGNDTIKFTAPQSGQTAGAELTVWGGLGADVITATNNAITGSQTTFGYSAAADSTLAAMDTIGFINGNTVGTFKFEYLPGNLDAGTFSAAQATGSNGVVAFSATFNSDATARAEYLNENLLSAGAAVVFKDGANRNYLFIQGGTDSDDLVVKLGDAANTKTLAVAANTAIASVTFS